MTENALDELGTAVKRMHLNLGFQQLDQYSLAVINRLFKDFDLYGKLRQPLTVEEIMERCGFNSEYASIPLKFMCEWLVGYGFLEKSESQKTVHYRALKPPVIPDMSLLENHVVAKAFPAGFQLLHFAYENAKKNFVCGADRNFRLYDDQSIQLWESYFAHPGMRVPSQLSAIFLYNRIKHSRKPVSILEVGAGSASGTLSLYRLLKERQELHLVKRFHISDMTQSFVEHVRTTLPIDPRDAGLFSYHVLDLNHVEQTDKIAPGELDVILGVNCFHYVRSYSSELPKLKGLLNSGGVLVIAGYNRKQISRPFHIELLGSLYPEYTDVETVPGVRPVFGILPAETLATILQTYGFTDPEIWPPSNFWDREIPLDFFCGVIAASKK